MVDSYLWLSLHTIPPTQTKMKQKYKRIQAQKKQLRREKLAEITASFSAEKTAQIAECRAKNEWKLASTGKPYMPYSCDLDNLKDIAGQYLTQIMDSINAIKCNVDVKKHIRLIGVCVRKCVLAGIAIPEHTLTELRQTKCIQYHAIMNATYKAEKSRVRLLSK